ncbi:hypothetical protein EIN_181260 [Entamoeba invadens IP1]|uniref:hypothetical protein n=1 Tax=Entamoeba invadens IP1 TaxID=370355 RepID=UPI0002C3EBB6|nr:hypothetical protein EIN_181260 [Entamoeba invadens IP1]ELP93969.1 hypothetical protein EIN_181260 [Entamoeba invadens IP1]|eukprot:XP_004260740.1 hypothetical protein EIN_181260 [Entamoeba invadens IP1]
MAKTAKLLQNGYMVKEGSNVKNWKKRWFDFMSDGVLNYYTNRQETCQKGSLDLTHATQVIKNNTKKLMLEVTFDTQRVFRLRFDDESVEDRWFKCFTEYIDDRKTYLRTGFSIYDPVHLDSFTFSDSIGATEKGQVQNVKMITTQRCYSLKTLRQAALNDFEKMETMKIHESLRATDSAFVIQTLSIFVEENLYFVMTSYPSKRLADVMNKSILPVPRIKFYATEILLALNALKQCNYVHREINPETIFIGDDGHVLVSTPIGLNLTYKSGINYVAPEIIQKKSSSFSCDFWSLGIILFSMAFGDSPFFDTNPDIVAKKIMNEPVNFPYNTFPEVESFIAEMLEKDPTKRACEYEILKKRPIFIGISFEKFIKKEISVSN